MCSMKIILIISYISVCIIKLSYIPMSPVSGSNSRFLRSLSANTSLLHQGKFLSATNTRKCTLYSKLFVSSIF